MRTTKPTKVTKATKAPKAKTLLKRLERAYGVRKWRSFGKAVDLLVETILSQNTNDANSSAGYRRLRRRFRTWNRVADAPVCEVEECIRVSGLSRIKAPRIQRILQEIRASRGKIDLEFLKSATPRQAYDYLTGFNGVGPKTAQCVLLFAFGMPVFPVDTHIFRIARRLGLLPRRATAANAHEVLTPLIAPEDRYAMHILLIAHGRRTCRARGPLCEWCCLLDLCPHGRVAARKMPPGDQSPRRAMKRTTPPGPRGARRGG